MMLGLVDLDVDGVDHEFAEESVVEVRCAPSDAASEGAEGSDDTETVDRTVVFQSGTWLGLSTDGYEGESISPIPRGW